jgi:hypothetical protein
MLCTSIHVSDFILTPSPQVMSFLGAEEAHDTQRILAAAVNGTCGERFIGRNVRYLTRSQVEEVVSLTNSNTGACVCLLCWVKLCRGFSALCPRKASFPPPPFHSTSGSSSAQESL